MTTTTDAAELTDVDIATQLRRTPGILQSEQTRASRLHEAARVACAYGPIETVQAIWAGAISATRAASALANPACRAPNGSATIESQVAQLRIASGTADVFEALVSLGQQKIAALCRPYTKVIGNSPEQRAILDSKPALRKWLAERDGKAAQHDAAAAADRDARAAAAPAELLTRLRSRGVVIELERGAIVLQPAEAAKLTPGEVDALRNHREAIVALMKREAADAPKPLRI